MSAESISALIAAHLRAKAERAAALERARAAVRGYDLLVFRADRARLLLDERACPDCATARESGYLDGAAFATLREPHSSPCRRHQEARMGLLR